MSAAPRDASLLQVPASEPAAVEDEEDDEDAFKVHLIPRSSPTPRKKAAGCQETEDPSLSRKVSFADTRGLALEEVQYFTEFAFPESPEPPELGARQAAECPFYVFPAFVLPADPAQLLQRVRAGKVALETIEPAEGDPLSVRGWVRVLNLSYQKAVHVRATLDGWATYFDHPADYVPERSPGETDRFAFRLSFVAPYVRDGGRLEFVVRYQTPEAVHWANNGGANYSLVCKVKERAPAIAAAGVADTGPSPLKSCLKPAVFRYKEDEDEEEDTDWERHDWTNDADANATSAQPNDWTVQVPRVQVITLSPQAGQEGLAEEGLAEEGLAEEGPTEETQAALEGRVRRSLFLPIGVAREEANSSGGELESHAQSCPAFPLLKPVTLPSLGPSEAAEGEEEEGGGHRAPDPPEAGGEGGQAPGDLEAGATQGAPLPAQPPPPGPAEPREARGPIGGRARGTGGQEAGSDPWAAETVPHQAAAPPVAAETPGACPRGESAKLHVAADLHAVGAYRPARAEPGATPSTDDPPPSAGEEEEEEHRPEEATRPGAAGPDSRPADTGTAQRLSFRPERQAAGAPAIPGALAAEREGPRAAKGVDGDRYASARAEGAPDGYGGGPLEPVAEPGWPGGQPDLEALAALKRVALLASVFTQLLVFLVVASHDAGSLLWCTLYLISAFLL